MIRSAMMALGLLGGLAQGSLCPPALAQGAGPDEATVHVGVKINTRWGSPDEMDFYVGSAGSPSFPFTEIDRVAALPDYDNDGRFALLMSLALLALAGVPLVVTFLSIYGLPIPGALTQAKMTPTPRAAPAASRAEPTEELPKKRAA